MTAFVDRIHSAIQQTGSFLVAGFDPNLSTVPQFIIEESAKKSRTDEEFVFDALSSFLEISLEAIRPHSAAVKPNVAFFEQYGIGGLRAFTRVCDAIRAANIPLIVDAKRGDIGTTAKAYSNAFLGAATYLGRGFRLVDGDALTVNPYLGFDTLEPFLEDCKATGKGIFVLVKTSNKGSADIQNFKNGEGHTVAQKVCEWIAENADSLKGTCGLSGLGAVVGATYPEEARQIRVAIPTSLFLVPGFGTQGGTASDALQGAIIERAKPFELGLNPGGVLVNASRGLFQGTAHSKDELIALVGQNARKLAVELATGARDIL